MRIEECLERLEEFEKSGKFELMCKTKEEKIC